MTNESESTLPSALPAIRSDVATVMEVTFEGFPLRVTMIEGEPWFYAVDVCKALDLTNPTMFVERLDEDEKSQVIDSAALSAGAIGNCTVNVVNESGLYTLILRSRDALTPGSVAHRFRKRITSEILPSLRKTGYYAKRSPVVTLSLRGLPIRISSLNNELWVCLQDLHSVYPRGIHFSDIGSMIQRSYGDGSVTMINTDTDASLYVRHSIALKHVERMLESAEYNSKALKARYKEVVDFVKNVPEEAHNKAYLLQSKTPAQLLEHIHANRGLEEAPIFDMFTPPGWVSERVAYEMHGRRMNISQKTLNAKLQELPHALLRRGTSMTKVYELALLDKILTA